MNLSEKNKQRDIYLDILKGIGMLCVIYNHCDPVIGKTIISQFHIPLFFVLSGITFGWDDCQGKPLSIFLRKKVKSLLLPYYLFGLLDLFIYLIVSPNLFDKEQLLLYILGMRKSDGYCFTGALWFLTALFSCQLFMYLIIKIKECKNRQWQTIGMFLLTTVFAGIVWRSASGGVFVYNLDTLHRVFPFFLLGCIISRSGLYKEYKNYNYTSSIWVWICLILVISRMQGMIDVYSNTYNIFTLYLLGGFLGSVLVGEAGKIIMHNKYCSKVRKCMTYIGQNSLYFLAIHQQMIIYPLDSFGITFEGAIANFIFKMVVCLVITGFIVLFINFAKKRKEYGYEEN